MEFMFTDAERQLTTERRLKFQGTVKIDLDQISFHPFLDRELDSKNVERLCEIFGKDGCQRLDIRNHVTAIVSRRHLRRACQAAGLTPEDLMTNQPQYPHLRFSGNQVQCLHGQHRLKAGEETLPPAERWWTVDLYLDDISPDLRNALVDEYTNEKQPTDGEVYRKIRQYQHEHNARFQNRWWSRLSANKAKRLRQLTSPDNAYLCAAFDALLAIPGLWNGMSLGSLNKVMALKCDDEIIHYLGHVKDFWATLVNNDRTQMARIDQHTVDTLQLQAPRASKVDRKVVKGKILSGEVFSNFSETERTAIWRNLRSYEACDGIIPSLHTFFRDISYLNICADAVKRLVVLNKQHPTVRSALVHSFQPCHADDDCLIQMSETSFRRQRGSNAEHLKSGYHQIWMYAMRHYPEMAKDVQSGTLKASPTRAKARAKADESVIYDMAALARKLGFQTTQIEEILKQSPDRQIARAALLKARKPDLYHYEGETFESLIDRITDCFALAIPNEGQPVAALITGRAVKLKDRCGAPQEQTQQLDRPYLFLDQLHAETVPQRNLSSLEVRRCIYYAFFGKPSSSPLRQTTTGSSTSGRSPADEPHPLLFVPDDDSHFGSESVAENIPRRSFGEGPSNGRQHLSGARQEQRRRWEERLVHMSRRPRERSLRSSTDERSTVSEPSSDSENLELQPGAQGTEQRPETVASGDVEMEDQEVTETDEDEQLNRGAEERAEQEHLVREAAEQGEQERLAREEQLEKEQLRCKAEEHASLTQQETRERVAALQVLPADHQETIEGEAANKPSQGKIELAVQSLIERWRERASQLNDENVLRSRRSLRTSQRLSKPAGIRKSRIKQRLTRQDINFDQLEQNLDEGGSGHDTLVEGPLPSSATLGHGGTMTEATGAAELGPSQQEPERYTADSLDPEQAQKEVDKRLAAEQSLFEEATDPPPQETEEQVMEGIQQNETPRTTAFAPNDKLLKKTSQRHQRKRSQSQGTKKSKKKKLKRFKENVLSETPQVEPDSRRRAEEQAQKVVTQLDSTVGTNPTSSGTRNQQHQNNGVEVSTPLAPRSRDSSRGVSGGDLPGDGPPRQRVTVTFHAYEEGGWRRTDTVSVNSGNLIQVENIANRYARIQGQNARFYDCALRKVSINQCVRAAIEDGTFTILMSFGRDLRVTRQQTALVAQLLENVGSDGQLIEEEIL